MLSANPRADRGFLVFSREFFNSSITPKYNNYIKTKGGIFKTINDVVNESIMRWNIPGSGQTLIKQQTSTSGTEGGVDLDITYYNSDVPLEELMETNELDITFRFLDGFVNYFYLYELFFHNYQKNVTEKERRFTMILTVLGVDDLPSFNVSFSKCLFTSIPNLAMGYDQSTRDFKEFQCRFTFSDFTVSFDLPQNPALTYKAK